MLLATILDVPKIRDFFMLFFLFIFAFIFLYTMLSGLKFEAKQLSFFPLKSNFAALIAFSLAMLLIFTRETKEMMKNIVPWISIVLLILILVMLVFQLVGLDIFSEAVLGSEGKKLVLYLILAVVLLIVFWNVGIVFNEQMVDAANNSDNFDYLSGKEGFSKMALAIVFHPLVFPTFIFLVVVGILVWFLMQD
ncbi:MAG: hypothetical protein QXR30_01630 [Candidatus Woesearchaeota archaeon]